MHGLFASDQTRFENLLGRRGGTSSLPPSYSCSMARSPDAQPRSFAPVAPNCVPRLWGTVWNVPSLSLTMEHESDFFVDASMSLLNMNGCVAVALDSSRVESGQRRDV
jgi:hypothetical protein